MSLGISGPIVARARAVLEADTRSFDKGMSDSEKRFKRSGERIGKIGLGIGVAAAAGATKAVGAYSDLHEEVNKAEVVFGKASKGVIAFSDTAAEKLGQSREEALRFASNFGNMLVPMGLGRRKAAELSVSLVRLSSDMASFNNADPSDVLQALQSGLAGQVRPLRQFGVFLSKDRIEAEAFSSGIAHTTKNLTGIKDAQLQVEVAQRKLTKAVKEHGPSSDQAKTATVSLDKAQQRLHKALDGTKEKLTQQQKTLATYRIITKDTKDAQGDFARTSDGLANSQRILHAEVTDVEETMGQALYPTVTKLVHAFAGFAVFLQHHQTLTKALIPVTLALSVGLITLSLAVKAYSFATDQATKDTLKWTAALLTNPVFLIVTALVALTIALVVAYKKSETFRNIVNAAFHGVKVVVGAVVDFIKHHWLEMLGLIAGGPLGLAIAEIVKHFDGIKRGIGRVIGWLVDRFSEMWNWLKEKAFETVAAIIEPFSHLPGGMGSWARKAKDAINKQLDEIHSTKTVSLQVRGGKFTEKIRDHAGHTTTITGDLLQGLPHAAGGRVRAGRSDQDTVHALLSKEEFVVTGGGQQITESLLGRGYFDWLEQVQPRHFAAGGRVASGIAGAVGSMSSSALTEMVKSPELLQGGGFVDELFALLSALGGGAVSTHGLVPQVLRALSFARGHGWHGAVSSGFRTHAEQAALYQRYVDSGFDPRYIAARPGTSSHEFGQAVDVTDYGTFGATMASAPANSRLYHRLGAIDLPHWSVSGYADGGRAGDKHKKHKKPPKKTPPKTPARIRAREARAAGTKTAKDDISALRAEERWIEAQLKRKDLSKAQKDELRVRLAKVRAKIERAQQKLSNQRQHDYSQLPPPIRYAISRSHLTTAQTNPTDWWKDDLTALHQAEHYLEKQLKRKGITLDQRTQIVDALVSVRDEISNIEEQAKPPPPDAVDPSALPLNIQEALADAELTPDTADDLTALKRAAGFYEGELATGVGPDGKQLTQEQRISVKHALKGIRDQMTGITGTTPGPDEIAAQLEANKAAVLGARSRFLSDFASNVFSPGAHGLELGSTQLDEAGSGTTIVNNFLRPPEDQYGWLRRQAFAAQR